MIIKTSHENDIIITGNRHSIIEYAVKSKVKLIVLTNGQEINKEWLELAKTNKVNIIKTNYSTLDTIKKFNFCNNVETIINTVKIHTVNENDDLSEFISSAEKMKYTYYPIVDNNKHCLGIIKDCCHGGKIGMHIIYGFPKLCFNKLVWKRL